MGSPQFRAQAAWWSSASSRRRLHRRTGTGTRLDMGGSQRGDHSVRSSSTILGFDAMYTTPAAVNRAARFTVYS